ncbi:hypothetical protein RFI_13023 [Reticulomyxa filosa]|uniref:Uncharacterized protein n=1 Tax=Reticulomyxa filosa TaxID=46433 RepID=X6NEF9_RETFI|nr:hypothetical protein RFI_13023 [Reticulomyxa filosa]|eukprot:ETO24139.1 hypothetical protein RFI_13023 [Reticulomyxa filosa]
MINSVRNSGKSKRSCNTSLAIMVSVLGILPFLSRFFRSDFQTGNWRVMFILLLAPIPTAHYLWVVLTWSVFMSTDFYNRWYRAKFCTNLLDPKTQAFDGRLRKYYRDHVFASLGKVSRVRLKKMDFTNH